MNPDLLAPLLAAALLLAGLAGLGQQFSYQRAARRMQAEHAGERDRYLVSGRAKGPLRGAVVLLVVTGEDERVIDARALAGASAFARFRPRRALLGPLGTLATRERDRAVLRAAQEAAASFRALRAARARRAAQQAQPA